MATVAKSPRTKKRTAKETAGTQEVPGTCRGLTDAQREAAIQRFLNDRRAGGRTFRYAIVATGKRSKARDVIATHTVYGWHIRDMPGELDLKADCSGLWIKTDSERWSTEWHLPIEWDEVIDAAIDADAGTETWDAPSDKGPTEDHVAAKQAAKLRTSGKLTMSDKIAAARLNGRVDAAGFAKIDASDVLTEHGAVAGNSEIAQAAKQTNGKPRRQPAAPPDRVVIRVDPAADVAAAATQLVPTMSIQPNPYQPRRNFDQEKLKQLAASIATDGLLQPIGVRPKPRMPAPGIFEIIDGERRLRAVQMLEAMGDQRFARIPVIVRETSDREMAKLALVANDQREDLDPIERARGYQRMIREHGLTQDELGASLGHGQAYIANAIRLLELPAEWQARVISREMSPSHARELLRIAEFPKLLKCVARRLKEEAGAPSLAGWNDWLDEIVRDEGRDLERGARWDSKSGENVPLFKPTTEQLEQLQVITARWYDNSEHRYCVNTKLFDQLQATHAKEWLGKRLKNAKATKESKGGVNPAKKLTPAQLKAKAAEQERIFAQRLDRWKILWLRWLIARELESIAEAASARIVWSQLLLYFACSSMTWNHLTDSTDREDDLCDAIGELKGSKPGGIEPWDGIAALEREKLEQVQRDVVLRWTRFDADGPATMIPDDVVPKLAEHLSIDQAKSWRSQLAGDLSESYFDLHTKDQLGNLAEELGVHVDPGKPKTVLVQQLLASPATKRKLPAELAPAKKAKAKKR